MSIKLASGSVTFLGLFWLAMLVEKILKGISAANPDSKVWKLRLQRASKKFTWEKCVYYAICAVYSFGAILIS
jgi:hypothetical protein